MNFNRGRLNAIIRMSKYAENDESIPVELRNFFRGYMFNAFDKTRSKSEHVAEQFTSKIFNWKQSRRLAKASKLARKDQKKGVYVKVS